MGFVPAHETLGWGGSRLTGTGPLPVSLVSSSRWAAGFRRSAAEGSHGRRRRRVDRGGSAASGRRPLPLPLRILPREAHTAWLQVRASVPLLWFLLSTDWLSACEIYGVCSRIVVSSGAESYRVPSCGSVSAGEQEPALPPDQLRSLYRVSRCYCSRSSCWSSSCSYVLHCYPARTKLGNVEPVDNFAHSIISGYYAFSPEIWKFWTGRVISYELWCSPLLFSVRQELSGIPPVYDRLVLMVCPELIWMFIWFSSTVQICFGDILSYPLFKFLPFEFMNVNLGDWWTTCWICTWERQETSKQKNDGVYAIHSIFVSWLQSSRLPCQGCTSHRHNASTKSKTFCRDTLLFKCSTILTVIFS